jgi:hypothetical protein
MVTVVTLGEDVTKSEMGGNTVWSNFTPSRKERGFFSPSFFLPFPSEKQAEK